MKKSVNFIFIFALVILLTASFVSAGWFGDLFGKITGNQVFVNEPGDAPVEDAIKSSPEDKYSVPDKTYSVPDKNILQKCHFYFGSDGWSNKFNTHSLDSQGDVESVEEVLLKYGLEEFEILDVGYYYNNNLGNHEEICVGSLKEVGKDIPSNLQIEIDKDNLRQSKLVCSGGNCKDYWIRVKINYSSFCDFPVPQESAFGFTNPLRDSPTENSCEDLRLVIGDKSERLYSLSFDAHSIQSSELLVNNTLYDEPIYFSPVSYNEKNYFVSGPYLYSFNFLGKTPQIVWNYSSGTLSGHPNTGDFVGNFYQPVISEDGFLYVGTSGGYVLSFDLNNLAMSPVLGTPNPSWVFPTLRGDLSSNHPVRPVVSEGYVVYGSPEKGVIALNKTTGNKLWEYSEYKLDERAYSEDSPVIYDSKVYLTKNIDSRSVIALDLITGNKLWESSIAGPSISQAVVGDGNLIYVGNYMSIIALNKNDGSIVWSRAGVHMDNLDRDPDKYFGTILSTPVVMGDVLYFSTNRGSSFALNKSNGVPIQKYLIKNVLRNNEGTGDYYYLSSPLIRENLLIVSGGMTNKSAAIFFHDLISGEEIARFSLKGSTEEHYLSSPIFSCASFESPSTTPEGKTRDSSLSVWKRILGLFYSNPPALDVPKINALEPQGFSGCLVDSNNCIELEDGRWVCDRQFCTLYELEGLLVPNLDFFRLLSINGETANLNLSSNGLKSLKEGEKIELGNEGKGILMLDLGQKNNRDYVFFQVGESGDLSGKAEEDEANEEDKITEKDNCKDSDGGKDHSVYGWINFTTRGVKDSYLDRCAGRTNILYEASCNGIYPQIEQIDCSSFGMVCENGACVEGDSLGGGEDDPAGGVSCSDSDGGLDSSVLGTITYSNNTSFTDICFNESHVKEYVCGEKTNAFLIPCRYGCEAGVCADSLGGGEDECTLDTDCGPDGFVEGIPPFCDKSKSSILKFYVTWSCEEGTCKSETTSKLVKSCSNGCDLGVCLGEVEDCVTDDDCEDGLVCRGEKCVGSSGKECSNNFGCDMGEYCSEEGICTPYSADGTSCSDSDGGFEFFRKGIVNDITNGGTYTDYCFKDGNTLVEHACGENHLVTWVEFECPNGCENGACNKEEDNQCEGCLSKNLWGNVKCYEYGSLRQKNLFSSKEEVCTLKGFIELNSLDLGDSCVGYFDKSQAELINLLRGGSSYICEQDDESIYYQKWIDSNEPPLGKSWDGGKNKSEVYRCVGSNEGGNLNINPSSAYLLTESNVLVGVKRMDVCLEGNKVVDYYCEGKKINSAITECPKGYSCETNEAGAGYCSSSSGIGSGEGSFPKECSETDNGISSFEKGRTNNGTNDLSDYCSRDKTLVEYFCSEEDESILQKEFSCPHGCDDGACREQGCVHDGVFYDSGEQFKIAGVKKYCHNDTIQNQLDNGEVCVNDYECDSGKCCRSQEDFYSPKECVSKFAAFFSNDWLCY